MKKILFTVALCALLAPVFAIEWGGVVKNNSQVSTPDFSSASINQADELYLWANQPLTEDGSIYASGEVFYSFKYAGSLPGAVVSNVIDCDLLKVSGAFELGENAFGFNAGRYFVSDNSGAVFSQVSDGASVSFALPMLSLSAYAGYTGLLNGKSVTLLDSSAAAYSADEGIYVLSHGFIPVIADISFPVLFGNQSLALQCAAFIDTGAEKDNRYYGNLVISGPVANAVYYKASVVAGSTNFKNVMCYSAADLYVFPTDSFMINAGVEYASGNNGPFAPFAGISSRQVSSALSGPETSGVVLVKANMGISNNALYTGAGAKIVMDCMDSFGMKGVEGTCTVSYNIFSDLQVGLDVAGYYDLSASSDSNYSATVRVAMSF
ncbi:MAG: hypothetical protein MJ162_02560 [Treponema sp.]|nr:hypothetical protein [Treponema sp.]